MAMSWILSPKGADEGSVDLARAKAFVPDEARVPGPGLELDPDAPPPGMRTISIRWDDGETTKHFVRNEGYRITHRRKNGNVHTRVAERFGPKTRMVLTALDVGEFAVTPLMEE